MLRRIAVATLALCLVLFAVLPLRSAQLNQSPLDVSSVPTFPTNLAANETVLFSGGWTGATSGQRWSERIGHFGGSDSTISAMTGVTVTLQPPITLQPTKFHAEAQIFGLIGTNFSYAADVVVTPMLDVDLQFRISDEGRYGVQVRTDGMTFYRLRREDRPCDENNTSTFTHCPSWPEPTDPACPDLCDDPQWIALAHKDLSLAAGTLHHLVVRAQGSEFDISLDGAPVFDKTDESYAVGRFGIYTFGTAESLPLAKFSNILITTDPTQPSNFALLYSTAGYEAEGTKRALVRTLNDLPTNLLGEAQAGTVGAEQSTFTLENSDGVVVKEGQLRELAAPDDGPADTSSIYLPMLEANDAQRAALHAQRGDELDAGVLSQGAEDGIEGAKTFGMQLWEADFSSVITEGTYTLFVNFVTAAGAQTLQSAPFEIRSRLVTNRMLKPLSILNAQARFAADDDMRRNWQIGSGDWSVTADGAFLADRADSSNGALLTRIFNINNWPIYATNFRYVGDVTIISGCDAQMQFRITETERWAVTLQAGAGGNCAFGGGAGAVRLHREATNGPFPPEPPLASWPFPPEEPLRAGQSYRLDIYVVGNSVTVRVDGVVRLQSQEVPPRHGRFALKAWASTVRFDHVQAWDPTVTFLTRTDEKWDGTLIPVFANWTDKPNQVSEVISCQSFKVGERGVIAHDPVSADQKQQACNPFFGQIHGFHDANNNVAEASSHGAFLAGLMKVWTQRAYSFSAADRETLREAIQASVLYLEELYQEGSSVGEFAHSEMGRAAVDTNLGPWQTVLALYGLSAFAADGTLVDRGLARQACERAIDGAMWLEQKGYFGDLAAQSVIYGRIARCAVRENLPQCSADCQAVYQNKALAAVNSLLTTFATPGVLGRTFRDTSRVMPWFEGTYELLRSYPPEQLAPYTERLNAIAALLVTHLTQEHACDDAKPNGARCAANGFYVLPQAGGDNSTTPLTNWEHMDQVPDILGASPFRLPFVHFYHDAHFAIATADAVYLALLTGRGDLEPVVTGNFYWILGLNPGVPANKAVLFGNGGGRPWQAASFIYNLDAPFLRTIDGFRVETTSAKTMRNSWEVGPGSPHHESWSVDPLNNGFQSIVNGHVLVDGQWDYWNTGFQGWASGETFILHDGLFLLSAILLEDWLAPGSPAPANPYDTTRLAFFDTTHIDRATTGWGFDDPDWSEAAQASRAATEFCNGKGFGGGRFTGHYIRERIGLICVKATVSFFDATDEEIAATEWDFQDINQTHWAQVARAATGFCNARGFVGGFFTGHQIPGARGIICLGSDAAQWFDATDTDLYNSGQGFDDINTVPWAKAARGATNICLGKGFAGGFMTGHRVPGNVGVVCFAG